MRVREGGRARLVRQALLLLCILLTVIFIWSNSMRNAVESDGQSGFWKEIFRQIFNVEMQPFKFIYENLRKTAHFLEFALLGGEVLCFLLGYYRRVTSLALGMGVSFSVAAIDETIQYFVPGRVAAVSDVLLDGAGALFGILLCLGLSLLFFRLFKKK